MAVLVVSGAYLVTKSLAASNQLYLTPASGTVLQGNNVDVAIRMDSGAETVNAVQANLTYDPAKLQFVGISPAGTAFGLEAQSTGGAGAVNIARATNGGTPPVSGDQLVATVTFKALVASTTASVTFASGSAVVRSTDNTNILVSSGDATFTLGATTTPTPSATPTPTPTPTATPVPSASPSPSASPAASSGRIYLNPASGTIANGTDLTFDIHEDSGATPVNAIQVNYDYSSSLFQFVSISTATSAFGLQAQSTGTGGQIRIARGVNAGSPAITGDHIVATVTLHPVGTGAATVTPATGSALVRSSDSTDILVTKDGGSYTLAAGMGSGTPSPTPPATPAPTPAPTVSIPVPVSVTGSHKPIPVKKTIKVAAPALPATTSVAYTVDGQSSTSTIDTTKLGDGTHTITATSQNAQGKTSEVKQKIAVQNKPTSQAITAVLAAARPYIPWAGVAIVLLIAGGVGIALFRHSHRPTLGGGGMSGGSMGGPASPSSPGTVYEPGKDNDRT